MFTLTPMEATLLAVGVLTVTSALVLGVLFAFPRSGREIAAYVRCPMLSRRLGARLVRDDWTRRFDRVVRCDALGSYAPLTCNQRCLRGDVAAAA
ncbi:MAG TPA: hypothetical protein VGM22_03085 [Methylomirabilota bacterium]|jgi:hypothetical protein